MDIPQINHLSLCSGYGGIDLGLRRALGDAMRTVAYSEIEAFAIELLLTRMENGQLDEAPVWPDLRSFPWAEFVGRISILSGGYPCQPFSSAGRRQGANDPRHIWPFIRNGIAIIKPTVCFFENVEGHISMGLSNVIEDLVGMGYRVTWGIFSAAEVGAPHQRKRIFIMANNNKSRLERMLFRGGNGQEGWQSQGGSPSGCCQDSGGEIGHLANSYCPGSWEDREPAESWANGAFESSCDCGCVFEREDGEMQIWPSRPGQKQHEWEPPRVVANAILSGRQPARHECGPKKMAGDCRSKEIEGNQQAAFFENEGCDGGEELGNTAEQGFQVCGRKSGPLDESGPQSESERSDEGNNNGKTESTLGGDSDGSSCGLGDANMPSSGQNQTNSTIVVKSKCLAGIPYDDLVTSCDNRTDELRLLGNGVVPATAEIAFNVLIQKLMQ